MKRILTSCAILAATIGGADAATQPVAAAPPEPENEVTVSAGSARCTSPLDGTWTAGWLVDAASATPGNTWVLTSPDGSVTALPSSSNTTLVSGFLELVTTADSVAVDWAATFGEGNSVSGTTPTLERPTEDCEPLPPTDGLEYTLACGQFEGARFLVVDWQDGAATGSESIPLASGTLDDDTGEIVGGQYPPDLVDVTISTPTGSYAFSVQIPADELCGPTRTVVTTTTTTTTTTTSTTSTTTASTTSTTPTSTTSTTTVPSSTDVTSTTVDATTTTANASGAGTTTTVSSLPETGGDLNTRLVLMALALVAIGAAVVATTRRPA